MVVEEDAHAQGGYVYNLRPSPEVLLMPTLAGGADGAVVPRA